MNTAGNLTLIGALAGCWLLAGLLADALPDATTARGLLRRTRTLSTVVGAGALVLAAVPVITRVVSGMSAAAPAALLPAAPALVVLTVTLRRLGFVRRGAAALSAAPRTPVPPALRAAAAHPLIATPVQVTGLAAVVGLPMAAGVVQLPGANAAGLAITVVGLAVAAIGVRHALRHSRLAALGLAVIGSGRPRSMAESAPRRR